MKVIVTGGSGFIGQRSIREFLRQGWEVVNLDVRPSEIVVETHLVDVANADAVNQVFRQTRPISVLHLAAQISVATSVTEPLDDMQRNIVGSVNVFEAARQNGVRRVVSASSAAIYGNDGVVPISEETLPMPTSPYGISKLTAELYLRQFYSNFYSYAVMRYGNVYGAAQRPETGAVIANFVRDAITSRQATVHGDGGQLRDFVHVDDIARLNALALQAEASMVVNVGSGTPVAIRDILQTIGRLTGQVINIIHKPTRAGDIYASYYDAQRVRQLLGWTPSISLEAGLAEIIRELGGC